MAYPATYADWIILLKDWIDVEDLSDSQIDTCLALAQTRLNKELSSQFMEAQIDLVVPASFESFTLSTAIPDFNRMRLVVSSQNLMPLEGKAWNEYNQIVSRYNWDIAPVAGNPPYPSIYSVESQKLYIWPIPAEDSVIQVSYYKKVPALAATTQETNAFSVEHPDLLLFASCIEISAFVVEDERVPVWQQRYAEGLQAANGAAKDAKLGSTPLTRAVTMYQTIGTRGYGWGWN